MEDDWQAGASDGREQAEVLHPGAADDDTVGVPGDGGKVIGAERLDEQRCGRSAADPADLGLGAGRAVLTAEAHVHDVGPLPRTGENGQSGPAYHLGSDADGTAKGGRLLLGRCGHGCSSGGRGRHRVTLPESAALMTKGPRRLPEASCRLGWMQRQVTSTPPATRAGTVNAKYACRTGRTLRTAVRRRPAIRDRRLASRDACPGVQAASRSRACWRSAGYGDSNSTCSPVSGCSKPSRTACSHWRCRPRRAASVGSAP